VIVFPPSSTRDNAGNHARQIASLAEVPRTTSGRLVSEDGWSLRLLGKRDEDLAALLASKARAHRCAPWSGRS
jgi:hypothetical protein